MGCDRRSSRERDDLIDGYGARAVHRFERVRRSATLDETATKSPLSHSIDRLERLCVERRQLGEQARLHFWLHVWLFLHIPITVVLLVLGTIHAVMSVYW